MSVVLNSTFRPRRPLPERVDQNDAVAGTGAIKRSGRSAFQHRDALDVFGIQTGDAVAPVEATPHAGRTDRRVVDRHAVDHDQRLVVAGERRNAADHDAGRGARATGRRIDLQAGHLALQQIAEVGLGARDQVLCAYLADGVAYGPGFPLDAQRRDHDLAQLGHGRLQQHLQVVAAVERHVLRFVSHERKSERGLGAADGEHEVAVGVGGGPVHGAHLHDVDARQGTVVVGCAHDASHLELGVGRRGAQQQHAQQQQTSAEPLVATFHRFGQLGWKIFVFALMWFS